MNYDKMVEQFKCQECNKPYDDKDYLKEQGGHPLYWLKIKDNIVLFCGPICSNNYHIKQNNKANNQ